MPGGQNSLNKLKKIRGGRKRKENFLEKQKKLLHKELINCPEKAEKIAADITDINREIQSIHNEKILDKLVQLQSLIADTIK